MPELSIIIITWNAEKYVKNCLDSVLESTKHISSEMIIIDNGSSDATNKIITNYLKENIFYLPLKENLGVAGARNIGLKKATGQFLWILDIDTIVNKDAIDGMLRFLKGNSTYGMVGCKLMNSQGEVQFSCRKFPSLKWKINNVLETVFSKLPVAQKLKQKIEKTNEFQFYGQLMHQPNAFPVDYVIGACQLIKKEAFDEVGLLDEKIFYGPEDADFCLRMWEKNWKVYYIPYICIIHEYQRMTNKKIFSKMSWIHTKALFYFFYKHKII